MRSGSIPASSSASQATSRKMRCCGSVADYLTLIAGFDAEGDGAALDGLDLRGRRDSEAHRRGREMAHVEMDAEALMSLRQQMLDRRQRRRLDHVDHHRRRQHRDAAGAHPGRRVLRRHDEIGGAGEAGTDGGEIESGHAILQSTLKSLGFQSGLGYFGSIASRVSRTIAAIAALRAHLRSAGMTCHGAQAVEHLLSISS